MNMRKLLLAGLLGLAVGPFGPTPAMADFDMAGLSIFSRLAAPLATFKEPIRPVLGASAAAGYARTFQKSGTKNRVVGVLPLLEWGILEVDFLTATGDVNALTDDRGMVGGGGSVQGSKVLTSIFPELSPYFAGNIPGTNGRVQWEMNFGAGAGYDWTASEPVALLYFAPKARF